MPLIPYLHQVVEGRDLSALDAQAAMEAILAGEASPAEIAALLVALRMKGEAVAELVGFARAMRQAARAVKAEGPLIDTCGTGGDGCPTFNISTVVAFVVAGAGVRVAKHGNRSISSRCGSADVMESLGIKIAHDPGRDGAGNSERFPAWRSCSLPLFIRRRSMCSRCGRNSKCEPYSICWVH